MSKQIFTLAVLSFAAMGAKMTFYESLPHCCPGTQNYDPNADDTECVVYSGCDWYGQFAYLSGTYDLDFVQSTNIVSLYSSSANGAGQYAGQYITISKSGYPAFTALVADTCGNDDCNGCCSANVGSDGWLVDVEYWTAVRHLQAANLECPLCSGEVSFVLASGPSAPSASAPSKKPTGKPTRRPTTRQPTVKLPTTKVPTKKPTTRAPTPKPSAPTNANVCPSSQAGWEAGTGAPGSICVSHWDCVSDCVNAQCTTTTGSIPSCFLACPSQAVLNSGAGIPGAGCVTQADCIDDCVLSGTTKRCTSDQGAVPACQ